MGIFMSDQLTYRIAYGDKQAFEILFRRLYLRLCCYTNKFLNDPEESQEIVQEVFSILWENRQSINPSLNLDAYLYKISKNLAICRLRRKSIELKYIEIYKAAYLDYDERNPSHDTLCAHELERKLAVALEKLPDGCRKVYELSRNEGLKYCEIAKYLDISVKTVESQMSKAFRILRIELAEFIAVIIFIML
jgi:RNA polymerase sigma-70 factor (ECF subfamily)